MTLALDKIHILVVDDKRDNLLAAEATLSELGESIVCASSWREALRHVLGQEFAVILLDINMPGMDGFETAELIRRYRGSRHTPIIFLTADGDELHVKRSYSLGAVDYILTPVVPEVLRSKVAVFIDLFRKTRELKRQAEAQERLAMRLHKLTAASVVINAATSLDEMLRAMTDGARTVIGTHQAVTVATLGQSLERARITLALSEGRDDAERPPAASFAEVYRLATERRGPLRLSREETDAHPSFRAVRERALPFAGFLSAPLTDRDGRVIGLLALSERKDGEFTTEDQAILVQLSQLASIAIQNSLHAEEREANRLKDEFLAMLSHELRTPLTAILGWTRLLRGEPLADVGASHALDVIERNAVAQTKLIEELLDLSRMTTGQLRLEKRRLSLADVIASTVDDLRVAAEAKEVTITTSLDPACFVSGDPDRLQQVASNLIANALKHTAAGGHIEVSLVAARRAGAARTSEKPGDVVQLWVRDDGVGIDPDFLPFVFDRFRQADGTSKRARGGLGLGLALVRHIVELHGGVVRAESPGPGAGATFVVELPRLEAEASEPAPAPTARTAAEARKPRRSASDDPGALRGLHVLLVEDNADTREILREVLKRHQADVTAVASAREAVEAIGARKPHVLVSDIAMPDEDGYELIRTVRRRGADEGGAVPALALTAHSRDEDRERALAAGFQMHAAKPIKPAELVAAIARLVSRP